METNRSTKRYELFYLWIIAPHRFFIELVSRFKEKKNSLQKIYVGLSFLFPLLNGTLLFSFLARFAIIQIADKIFPAALIWVILVILAFLASLLTLSLIPGFSLKYQLQKRGFGKLRFFNRINLMRNNLFQIPLLVILIIVNLTTFRRTWKIYNLGIYLGMIMIIAFIWVTVFQVSSLSSIQTQLQPDQKRKHLIPFYQYGLKAIWSTALFTSFCIALDITLRYWLGAEGMSLFHKLAMFLLHTT
ncbi:MAG: hypothetical protein JW776_02040 [Candidatus Lokiarchaeota archaeon]|nr:hypothetical protein [Candidatus Lokiarchaeota archaeon]